MLFKIGINTFLLKTDQILFFFCYNFLETKATGEHMALPKTNPATNLIYCNFNKLTRHNSVKFHFAF